LECTSRAGIAGVAESYTTVIVVLRGDEFGDTEKDREEKKGWVHGIHRREINMRYDIMQFITMEN